MAHLEDEQLVQLTLGRLDDKASAEAEAHLAACAECRTRHQNISSLAFSKTAVGPISKDGTPTRPDTPEATGTHGPRLERGTPLGRYVLLEKLGAGGMGEVFAAYDPHLDRKVALKLLRAGALSADEGKARLLREAQALARLQHPNVIAVHDVGTLGDRVFVAMEFVEGETLGEWLRGEHPWTEVLRVFRDAGAGLAAAHRAGLVHRDFKPDNVLLGQDGRPRVLDFGLARQATVTPAPPVSAGEVHESLGDVPLAPLARDTVATPRPDTQAQASALVAQQLTRDGAVMGTPGYMAPEQLAGLPTDARSDQFSFCVALYEGLYGKRPFGGATLKQHAKEMASGKLPGPPAGTLVPDWVYDVIKRGLMPNPADRWPDLDAMLRALSPRAERSARTTLFVVGLVVFSIFGVGYGLWTRQRLLVCGGKEQQLAGTWDEATKKRLQAGFLDSKLPYAADAWASTARSLDQWALDWVRTAQEACEATKVRKIDSEELLELRTACLEERRERLQALVGLFTTPDREVVVNAPVAARSLESALACGGSSFAARKTAADETERKADAELHTRMAEARALFDAGKYQQAVERLRPAITTNAPPRTQAEAYLFLGRVELNRGEPKRALLMHTLAAEQAMKAGDASLEARALSRVYASRGYDDSEGSQADAETWGRLAHAAAARAPSDWEVQVELAQNDAFVSLGRGRFAPALADFERVLALQVERLGAEHPDVAKTYNNLGVVLTNLGRIDEATQRYEESLKLHLQLEGGEHPNTAAAEHNLAVALRSQGRYQDARSHFERALEIRRKALGAASPETQKTALSLAKVYNSLGELEASRRIIDELREARVASGTSESKEMLPVLAVECELNRVGGFWKEALQSAQAHLELASRLAPGDTLQVATAQLDVGLAQTHLGAWADARRALSSAMKIRSDKRAVRTELAEAEDALGDLEVAQKHWADALPHFERAKELREKSPAPAPQPLAGDLMEIGRCQLELGRYDEALASLGRAEALFTEVDQPKSTAEVQVLRARATWLSRPDERGDAVELFMKALPVLDEASRAEVSAWLSKNGAGGLLDGGTPAPPDAGRP